MEKMIHLTIDNVPVEVEEGTTVLEAAHQAGIQIPTLCHLKEINELGACRMCVVDSGARSMQAACVLPAVEGMNVKTNTPQIQKYRRNLLELVLSTHEKKCLGCIRSQNCELQRMCLELGVENSGKYEGVKNEYSIDALSPSIVRDNNKCIVCRRCVAVCQKIQAVGVIGAANRGFKTTIASPWDKPLAEMSCINCGQCIAACPTGALYDDETLKGIAQIARENDLILLSDETYDRVIMDALPHTSIAALAPDVTTITFNGLSKSHRLCGYRVGWMVFSGPKGVTDELNEAVYLLASMRLCSNVPAQYAIPEALADTSPDPVLMPGGRAWEQRNCIWEAMNDIPGVSAVKPKATFYIFPKIDLKKYPIRDDEKFALDFLKERHVLVVNGTGFNWPAPDHFRVVFLARCEQLAYAGRELGSFLENYRQD